jgi:peroxiredoxin
MILGVIIKSPCLAVRSLAIAAIAVCVPFVARAASPATPTASPSDAAANAGATPADTNANSADVELKTLAREIKSRLATDRNAGKVPTEVEYSNDLKRFDAILNEHKGEKSDAVAAVLMAKAKLYLTVFGDTDKALEVLKQLQADYPDPRTAVAAGQMAIATNKIAEIKKVQASLVAGVQSPDFDEKDVDGKPLSIGQYKGKVVLMTFWATWDLPSRADVPNLVKAYGRYHDKGFDVIGVSLDESVSAMKDYAAWSKMPWPEYCDGKVWENKLALKYGINSIPMNFLIGKDGRIIDKGLLGDSLGAAVAKALGE